MSRLDELIAKLCPDGVEQIALGDIIFETKERNKEYRYDQVRSVTNAGILVPTSEYFDRQITSEDTSNYKVVRKGMFAYNPSRINIGSIAYLEENEPVIVSPMYVVFDIKREKVSQKYLMYYLRSGIGMHKINSKVEPGARFRLPIESLSKVIIPLPPLPVQQEIVRILDNFTGLTAELTAEQKARRKQYEYYRDLLLTFDNAVANKTGCRRIDDLINELCPNGVEYKKIKHVYKRIKGMSITATKMKEISDPAGEIRIFAGGKTAINAKETDIPQVNINRVPAVLVQSRGIIDVIYYDKPFTFKNEMWAYTAENVTSVKYLYYVLKNNIQYFRKSASSMGSLPQISLPVTEDFIIPLPPLPVQQEIVRILDKFDALINDLTSGLPAEIEARQKQYEYYRDKLLSFKEVSA